MGENENNTFPSGEQGARNESIIDFTRYSSDQLKELRDGSAFDASPLALAALLAEMQRRATLRATAEEWQVRFSRFNGVLGWLESLWRRSPVYGDGSVLASPEAIVLRGWQRTWLGAPIERAISLPRAAIRNVILWGAVVRFESKRRALFSRRIELRTADPACRQALIAALPITRTRRFERDGESLLNFEEQIRTRCPTAWITPALVAINVLAFVAQCLSVARGSDLGGSGLGFWAANIGPLTIDGQWWRLFTAIFVHSNLLHLLLNMWALWNIGRLTERLFGNRAYLGLYLGAGLIASMATLAWDPARGSVGASGAIFGLFGAFLAYLIRPGDLPHGVFRSHWVPTLLFVAFNLVSGALDTATDNAAHVGGLLGGFALGLVLARPVSRREESVSFRRSHFTATILIVGVLAAGFTYLHSMKGPVPVAHQFAIRQAWYVNGEARAVARWQAIETRLGVGTMNDDELAAQVQTEILPFWKDAHLRLQQAAKELSGEDLAYINEVAAFARSRKEWAEAVIAVAKGRDQQQFAVARARADEGTVILARITRLAMRSDAAQLTGGLKNLRVISWIRAIGGGHEGDCIQAPAVIDVAIAPTDSHKDGPVLAQQAACAAQRLYRNEDYRRLDSLLGAHVSDLRDLPGGGSSFSAFAGGLSDLVTYGPATIDDHLRQLAAWRRMVPGSFYPDLMEASLFNDWAWAARGHGTVNQVNQQAWALFAYRNEMAQAALDEVDAAARQDPLWCHLAMGLAHDRSHSIESIRAVFDQCMQLHPDYEVLYRMMLRSLEPRWFGSAEKVADFINEMVTFADEPQRNRMYARLYWIYASVERDDVNIFEDSKAIWELMHTGFEELQREYADSDLVLNAYARFACLAGDKPTYRAIRSELKQRTSATGWTSKTTMAGCDRKMLR